MFKRLINTINTTISRASTRNVLPTFKYSHHQHGYQYNSSYYKYIVLCPILYVPFKKIFSELQNADNYDSDENMKDQTPKQYARCLAMNGDDICGVKILLSNGPDNDYDCWKCKNKVDIMKCLKCDEYYGCALEYNKWGGHEISCETCMEKHHDNPILADNIICVECVRKCKKCKGMFCKDHRTQCYKCRKRICQESCAVYLNYALCQHCYSKAQRRIIEDNSYIVQNGKLKPINGKKQRSLQL